MPEITLETLKVTHRRKGVITLESLGEILLEGYFIFGTWAWLPLEGYMGKGAHQIRFFWRKNHLFPNVGLGKERSYFHHGVHEWEMPESLWISTPGVGGCAGIAGVCALETWSGNPRGAKSTAPLRTLVQGQAFLTDTAACSGKRLKVVWFGPDIWDCAEPVFHSDTMWHQEVVVAAHWSDLVLTSLECECRTAPLYWVFLEGGRVHFAMPYIIID